MDRSAITSSHIVGYIDMQDMGATEIWPVGNLYLRICEANESIGWVGPTGAACLQGKCILSLLVIY